MDNRIVIEAPEGVRRIHRVADLDSRAGSGRSSRVVWC
jgi:hypothetical protein